jgi:hypothetical protein
MSCLCETDSAVWKVKAAEVETLTKRLQGSVYELFSLTLGRACCGSLKPDGVDRARRVRENPD